MAAPPDNHQAPLKYKTWALKVPIHCEGCKKKVRKILQSMDGVYMTTIDSHQHKVIVTGNIEAETLLKKLSKSGKPAQLWPDQKSEIKNETIQEPPPPPPPNPEDKEKTNPNPQEQPNPIPENSPDKTQEPPQTPTESGNDQSGQSKRKKKKKNKGQNGNSPNTENPSDTPSPPESTVPPPVPPESVTPSPPPPTPMAEPPPEVSPPPPPGPPIESLNLGPPNKHGPIHNQAQPYFGPPGYNIHLPQAHNPQLGVSYNMTQPPNSGSYYVPQASPYYAYPQHPMMHLPPPPPRHIYENYYDREYNNDDDNQCRLM